MNWDEMAGVGRVARPHGIRGQVVVNPDTDFLFERFQAGAEFFVRRAAHDTVERLVVATARFHNQRPILGFEGVADMNAAAALVGCELRIPVEQLAVLPPQTFYRHDLIGCVVESSDGRSIGTVKDVEGSLGGSRLVIPTGNGEILIPLAAEICRSIDVTGKRIVVDPPTGLLELNERA